MGVDAKLVMDVVIWTLLLISKVGPKDTACSSTISALRQPSDRLHLHR